MLVTPGSLYAPLPLASGVSWFLDDWPCRFLFWTTCFEAVFRHSVYHGPAVRLLPQCVFDDQTTEKRCIDVSLSSPAVTRDSGRLVQIDAIGQINMK